MRRSALDAANEATLSTPLTLSVEIGSDEERATDSSPVPPSPNSPTLAQLQHRSRSALWRAARTLFLFTLLCATLFLLPAFLNRISPRGALPPAPPPAAAAAVSGSHGAVAADHPECSAMGVNVMRDLNGNAADALVATLLCQGVYSPFASGIGGGALFVIHSPNGTAVCIDGRETAPSNARMALYESSKDKSIRGGLAVAVPGELRALEKVHRKFGTLKWTDLVNMNAHAAEAAPVSKFLAHKIVKYRDYILASPTLLALLRKHPVEKREEKKRKASTLKNVGARQWQPVRKASKTEAPGGRDDVAQGAGTPHVPKDVNRDVQLLEEGDTLRNPALANTLRAVAARGANAFYVELAANLSADVRAAGGVMTERDISTYEAKEREPIESFYHGLKVLGAPLPSAGGPSVAMALNVLEGFAFRRRGRNRVTYAMLVETLKYVFGMRMNLGDGDFVRTANIAVDKMLSRRYARAVRNRIDISRTFAPQHYASGLRSTPSDRGTTHVSVIDKDGMAIAVTSTINFGFGSGVVSRSGIILNNEMDDFTSSLRRTNLYGLYPSRANRIQPGKRPLSSMAPTIVLYQGSPYLVIGGSGGPRIITATLQALLNVIDWGDTLEDAISAPRLHHQLVPNMVKMESINATSCVLHNPLRRPSGERDGPAWAYWPNICTALKEIGHKIDGPSLIGVVQGIVIPDALSPTSATTSRQRTVYAASDPRKNGKAAAY